jgi:hypothetical protein
MAILALARISLGVGVGEGGTAAAWVVKKMMGRRK